MWYYIIIYKEIKMENIIAVLKSFGDFNNWKGYINLYLTSKEISSLRKCGITKDSTLLDAYNILTSKKK